MISANAKRNEVDLTEGPLLKRLIVFSIPLVLSALLQSLYNSADMLVIGQFSGGDSLAAVGASNAITALIVNLFISLSVGTSVTVSTAIGAKDAPRISRLVHTSIALALVSGVLVTAVGIGGAKTFLGWLDTPADIMENASVYLRIIFGGSLFSLFYNFGAAVLRSAGDSRRPLIFLVISGAVNVVLNLVFVIVFRMGVAGVAIATVISQALSAVLILRTLLRTDGSYALILSRIRFHARETADILRTGLPACMQSVVFSFSNAIIQKSINSFATAAVTGNTAAQAIDGFIYTAMNALQIATVTAVGQNVGARRLDRVSLSLRICLTLVTATGLLVGGVVMLFRVPLLSLYIPDDPEALAFGMIRLNILAPTYFLCGCMEVLVGACRGMGNTIAPMIASIIGVCGIRLVWIFTAFVFFPSLPVLYWSYPISWIATIGALIVLYCLVRRRLERITA